MESREMQQGVSSKRVVGDITKTVDIVVSKCYGADMFQNTVEEAMHSRLWHEEARTLEIDQRLKELIKAHNEYVDLQKEAESRKKRAQVLFSLVGPIDPNPPEGQSAEHRVAINLLREGQEELRARLPLWKAMREYLSHVPEARIAEMEAFFQSMDYADGNRQAMESALKRHPKVFKIRKERREKYLSLK